MGGPWAGQQSRDSSEPLESAGGGGADHGARAPIALRKHAKNVAGSEPVGQDHKEAFVLGGVQGVDGQNGRGGGSAPWGGTGGWQRCRCCPHTRSPFSLPPSLAPRGFLYQAPDFRGGSPWGQVPPFSLLTSLGLEGGYSLPVPPF